eukprot:1565540-Rhodomonas_salina.1
MALDAFSARSSTSARRSPFRPAMPGSRARIQSVWPQGPHVQNRQLERFRCRGREMVIHSHGNRENQQHGQRPQQKTITARRKQTEGSVRKRKSRRVCENRGASGRQQAGGGSPGR